MCKRSWYPKFRPLMWRLSCPYIVFTRACCRQSQHVKQGAYSAILIKCAYATFFKPTPENGDKDSIRSIGFYFLIYSVDRSRKLRYIQSAWNFKTCIIVFNIVWSIFCIVQIQQNIGHINSHSLSITLLIFSHYERLWKERYLCFPLWIKQARCACRWLIS